MTTTFYIASRMFYSYWSLISSISRKLCINTLLQSIKNEYWSPGFYGSKQVSFDLFNVVIFFVAIHQVSIVFFRYFLLTRGRILHETILHFRCHHWHVSNSNVLIFRCWLFLDLYTFNNLSFGDEKFNWNSAPSWSI